MTHFNKLVDGYRALGQDFYAAIFERVTGRTRSDATSLGVWLGLLLSRFFEGLRRARWAGAPPT